MKPLLHNTIHMHGYSLLQKVKLTANVLTSGFTVEFRLYLHDTFGDGKIKIN